MAHAPGTGLLIVAITLVAQIGGHSAMNAVVHRTSATVVSTAILFEAPGAAIPCRDFSWVSPWVVVALGPSDAVRPGGRRAVRRPACPNRGVKRAQRPAGYRRSMTETLRSRRSNLAVPGSSPKMLEGRGLPADQVFMDIEDAVAPIAKPDARKNIVAALNEEPGLRGARSAWSGSTTGRPIGRTPT